jgi:hypothetical protein
MNEEQKSRYKTPLILAKSIAKQPNKAAERAALRLTTRAFYEAFKSRPEKAL